MSDVQKFDPNSLMDGVRAKIRASFVELIPDDAWDQMVKREIDNFMVGAKNQWNNSREQSGFERIVREELDKVLKERVRVAISEIQPQWEGETDTYKVNEMLRAEIIKRAPEMFLSMIENAVSSSISNMHIR